MPAKRIYPWEEWFARSRVVLVRGVDYDLEQGNMMSLIRNAASLHRINIKLLGRGDSIVVWTRKQHTSVSTQE